MPRADTAGAAGSTLPAGSGRERRCGLRRHRRAAARQRPYGVRRDRIDDSGAKEAGRARGPVTRSGPRRVAATSPVKLGPFHPGRSQSAGRAGSLVGRGSRG
jgi:hypothetical protein